MSLSEAKASQLIGTGALLVITGSGLFALLYIIHGEEYEFGNSEIFDRNSAFWAATPVVVIGLLGVLAGMTKKNIWVSLYMIGAIAAAALAILVAIVIGIKVSNIRAACGEDSACRNSDTAVLMGTIVLLSSLVVTIAIWGGVKACQSKWGPGKNVSKLRIVGEFRSGNGPTPPLTVVTNHAAQPNPSGEEMAIVASQEQANPPTNEAGYEPMDGKDSNKYEEVIPKAEEVQCENTHLRGEGSGSDNAGYESVEVVVENHKYQNVVPESKSTRDSSDPVPKKTSPVGGSLGVESPGVGSQEVDSLVKDSPGADSPIDNSPKVAGDVNNAYESDEIITTL